MFRYRSNFVTLVVQLYVPELRGGRPRCWANSPRCRSPRRPRRDEAGRHAPDLDRDAVPGHLSPTRQRAATTLLTELRAHCTNELADRRQHQRTQQQTP